EEEKSGIVALLGSDRRQWSKVTSEIKAVRKTFGPDTPLGKRRSTFGEAGELALADLTEAFVEREPLTVVVSEKGWIRALKGHVQDVTNLSFKTGDSLKTAFFAGTTSKLLVLASNGRVFTLDASKLPGGRGQGEPIRLAIDLEESADIIAVVTHRPGAKR